MSIETTATATATAGASDAISEPSFRLGTIGRRLFVLGGVLRGLGAFGLITLGVMVTKFNVASPVMHPLIRNQVYRAGVRLLPTVAFLAMAIGFVVVGQTIALLTRVGVQDMAGTIMITVIVRELGPIATALLVLARVGTATVIELATARALGEVEALEALGIDPVHYLVVPRVIGLSLSIFALTVYLILTALVGAYLFAFLQDVPLTPDAYLGQLAASLRWDDFLLLTFKTLGFGIIIAVVTCYEGLSKPLRIEDVSGAATRAVESSLILCVALDAVFIVYLLVFW